MPAAIPARISSSPPRLSGPRRATGRSEYGGAVDSAVPLYAVAPADSPRGYCSVIFVPPGGRRGREAAAGPSLGPPGR